MFEGRGGVTVFYGTAILKKIKKINAASLTAHTHNVIRRRIGKRKRAGGI